MALPKMIYTKSKWFNLKIFIESSGDKIVDQALKSTFHDKFHGTAPLEMRREDVQICLNFKRTSRLKGKQNDSQGTNRGNKER